MAEHQSGFGFAQFVNRIMCSHRLGYPPMNVYHGTPFA